MHKLKVGIIGTGMAFECLHYPAYQRLVDKYEIVALCDVDEFKARDWANRLQLDQGSVYTDYREMLRGRHPQGTGADQAYRGRFLLHPEPCNRLPGRHDQRQVCRPVFIAGMSCSGALSKAAKIALAQAASAMGTAINTGEAQPPARRAGERYQTHRPV